MQVFSGLALAGCVSLLLSAGSSGSTRPLVIAVEGPQSGEQAATGLDQLRGVRLAVKQLNAHGGLWDGRKVAVEAQSSSGDKSLGEQLQQIVRQLGRPVTDSGPFVGKLRP